MLTMTTEEQFLHYSSAEFLTEAMPFHIMQGDHDQKISFIEAHVIEENEYDCPEEILSQITNHALVQLNNRTPSQKFWAWIAQCPDEIYINHDFTDTEDEQKIHVFGFAVPITEGDQDDD